jgi:hypothetical protein
MSREKHGIGSKLARRVGELLREEGHGQPGLDLSRGSGNIFASFHLVHRMG